MFLFHTSLPINHQLFLVMNNLVIIFVTYTWCRRVPWLSFGAYHFGFITINSSNRFFSGNNESQCCDIAHCHKEVKHANRTQGRFLTSEGVSQHHAHSELTWISHHEVKSVTSLWDHHELTQWAHRRLTHSELTATTASWAHRDDLTNSSQQAHGVSYKLTESSQQLTV